MQCGARLLLVGLCLAAGLLGSAGARAQMRVPVENKDAAAVRAKAGSLAEVLPGRSALSLAVPAKPGTPTAATAGPPRGGTEPATATLPGATPAPMPAAPVMPLIPVVPLVSATPAAPEPVPAPVPAPLSAPASAPAQAAPLPSAAVPVPAPRFGSPPLFVPPAFSPGPAQRVAEEPAHEPGQVLVLWAGDEPAASGLAIMAQRYQLRPRQRYSLASLGFTVAMFALPTDRAAQDLRDQLRQEQPDWVVDLNARSTPLQTQAYAQPQARPLVDLPATQTPARLYAQKMLGTGAGNGTSPAPVSPTGPAALRLGVIDTGVDPALARSGALNGSVLRVRSVLTPADQPADTAHGSAVLQLIVGAARDNGFAGVAPPVQLAWVNAMREINGKPSTHSLALAVALDWLVGQQVALINLSLGGQGDAILKAVVARVLASNITLVAAVGNNPARDAPPVYPAAYPGVWGITAVDAAGRLYPLASRAVPAALAAPGVDLWVPQAEGGTYKSGTSFATALASAALAWQPPGFWLLPPAQRLAQVCGQARKLDDAAAPGCGLVQAKIAADY